METLCARCSRPLAEGGAYRLASPNGVTRLCRSCALIHRPLLLRSAKAAMVVGPILTILNQGDQLLGLTTPSPHLWWKIPLTFVVPFCVATYGSLANAKKTN